MVSPSPIATDIERKVGYTDDDVEGYHELVGGKLPAGRMGQREEMAAVALFLASNDSSFMYGLEIQADGSMNQIHWFDL